MSTESEQALAALNAATVATTEQTAVAQALTDEVASKQAAIDSALNASIEALQNAKTYDAVTGKNALSLTTTSIISALVAGDEIRFIVAETNDSTPVSIAVNGGAAIDILNISAANQLFSGALVTARFDGTSFCVIDQINPKTGNSVLDIAKLFTDTVDILRQGEYSLDGSALSRADHPIAFAIVSASSNYIDQATKDADPIVYGGFYGDGDGLSSFTLPIVGGEFIRMFDDGRGIDSGRVFGSFQEDAIRNIQGVINSNFNVFNEGASGAFSYVENDTDHQISTSGTTSTLYGKVEFDASLAVQTANENRPRSIAYYGKTRL